MESGNFRMKVQVFKMTGTGFQDHKIRYGEDFHDYNFRWNKLTNVFGSQNSSTRVLENNFLHQKWASENQALSTLRKSWTCIL